MTSPTSMPQHPEAIKQQMQETKSSIAEKLETLEQKVADRVEQATTAVAETVETVKTTVEDTVETVKTSVVETVDTVRDAFDLSGHVDRHPWAMVGGAVALGFVGGWLLSEGSRRAPETTMSVEPPLPSPAMSRPQTATAHRTTNGHHKSNGHGAVRRPKQQGFLTLLANALMPNFEAIKEGLLATVTSVVKEKIAPAIMEQAQGIVTNAAEKLQENFSGTPEQARSRAEHEPQEGDWFTSPGATRFPARN